MFEVVIGLEVHTQLNTKTKIFCACPTSFGEEQNSNVCPVCLALPGALPVLNKEAVRKAIAFGKAVDAKINKVSIFNRKNYFYPDLPKAYQISQFDVPIVEGGKVLINVDGKDKEIGITRAHLEEDAGKNTHEASFSKVDLNRCSTPLLEIVSEPDLRSADEAVAYLKNLHSIIRFLDISDANMQEGSFRCDVNVSIRPKGDTKLYTRVEIKNLNSFKFIHKAIDYEVNRQIEAWEEGVYEKEVYQETRLFDTHKMITKSMRGKEDSAEYRYFPEPDLYPVILDEDLLATNIPELPAFKLEKYLKAGVKENDAKVLISSVELCEYFEYLLAQNLPVKLCVSWLTTELLGLLEHGIESSPIDAKKLACLIAFINEGKISAKAGKEVLAFVVSNPSKEISAVVKELGLEQISDEASITKVILSIMEANTAKVDEYRAGKEKLFGFFVGQTMKQGAFNPAKVNELLSKLLKA